MTTNDEPMTLDEKIDAMKDMLNGVNTTVQDVRASQDESVVRFERFMEIQIGINAELMNMGKRAEQWMKDHEQRMEDHNLRMEEMSRDHQINRRVLLRIANSLGLLDDDDSSQIDGP